MQARLALLLVDFINPMEFDGGEKLAPRAVAAARETRRLKRQAAAEAVPVLYVNDHFGDWHASFDAVVRRCETSPHGREVVSLLRPQPADVSILKPRHSAFYGTPLEFLLDELEIDALVLTGLQAHICMLITAHDAYLRRYRLWVPSDCVASEHAQSEEGALRHLAQIAAADIRPAAALAESSRLHQVFETSREEPIEGRG